MSASSSLLIAYACNDDAKAAARIQDIINSSLNLKRKKGTIRELKSGYFVCLFVCLFITQNIIKKNKLLGKTNMKKVRTRKVF